MLMGGSVDSDDMGEATGFRSLAFLFAETGDGKRGIGNEDTGSQTVRRS